VQAFYGGFMTKERFIKFIPSEEAMWLLKNRGHAFRLLTIIAESARRYEGDPDGLHIGECYIGGFKNYDMSEQNYRTAKAILVKRQHLKIIETCRTRKNSTTGITTVSTKVKLLSSTVWDINSNDGNDRNNDCPTTDQRPTNDKLRKIRKIRKNHPSTPSFDRTLADRDDGQMTDDFSFSREKEEVGQGVFMTKGDLDLCLKIKGNLESVKQAIAEILASPKRKYAIKDWPHALSTWETKSKKSAKGKENFSYAEKLCEEFCEYKSGRGWRCSLYHEKTKDQRGVLFEHESAYQETFFVSLADGEMQLVCENFISMKSMRKKIV
jgi:hypothetical protein